MFGRSSKPSRPKFGSRQAMERYLESLARLQPALPVRMETAEWVEVDNKPSTSSSSLGASDQPVRVIDCTDRDGMKCFCCLECFPMKHIGCPLNPATELPDLLLQWNKIKFDCAPVPHQSSSSVSTSVMSHDDPVDSLSFDQPVHEKPSSLCSDCGTSLISTKALREPPGYCEYSGRLICGACFEPRQVVVPWKLVSGLSAFRGSVSRTAAKIIQSNLYASVISGDSVIARVDSVGSKRASAIMRHCKDLRQLFRLVTQSSCVREQIVQTVSNSLPAHMLVEDDMYSLADLIDLFSLTKPSFIVGTLLGVDRIIRAHACGACVAECVVCEKPVSRFNKEYYECQHCLCCYHKPCLAWMDTCPSCSSREPRTVTPCPDLFIDIDVVY